jgi:hypothetical protein
VPQLIKPKEVKIVTQDGEVQVSISLELTINLNTDGLNVTTQKEEAIIKKDKEPIVPDSNDWLIPDFDESPKLDFGKRG